MVSHSTACHLFSHDTWPTLRALWTTTPTWLWPPLPAGGTATWTLLHDQVQDHLRGIAHTPLSCLSYHHSHFVLTSAMLSIISCPFPHGPFSKSPPPTSTLTTPIILNAFLPFTFPFPFIFHFIFLPFPTHTLQIIIINKIKKKVKN